MRTLVCYVPDVNKGYRQLFDRAVEQHGVNSALLISGQLAGVLSGVLDIRALDDDDMLTLVGALGVFDQVELLGADDVSQTLSAVDTFLITRDDIGRKLVEWYLPHRRSVIDWDTSFLRWDKSSVHQATNIQFDHQASPELFEDVMRLARSEADKSSSAWRQVGCVAFRDGQVLGAAHNHHLPTEYSVSMEGDPRDYVEAGQRPDLCTAQHAEATLVARLGRPILEGSEVYCTTFPCVPCAHLLIEAGIKTLYYTEGNAYLHVDQLLKQMGVEIVYVPLPY